MRRLEAVIVPIRRAYDETYAQLSDPRNFPKWSPIPDPVFESVDATGLKWRVDLPRGRRLMQFAERNEYGVLDYTLHHEDGTHELTAYLRLIPNDEGCSLVALYFMRPGITDEVFASELTWITTDLQAAAAAIETGWT
jgi:hypothetical protein